MSREKRSVHGVWEAQTLEVGVQSARVVGVPSFVELVRAMKSHRRTEIRRCCGGRSG